MVIEHIFNMITMVLNKDRRGFVKTSQKTLAIKQAMYDYFDSACEVYRKTGVVPACILKFVKTSQITPLVNGVALLPTDYAQWVSGETDCASELTIVRSEEYFDRIHSEILAPDQQNPLSKLEDNKIYVQPDEFESINLTYIRRPIDFVYGVTTSGDGRSETFDLGTSVDIEFGYDHSKEIIRMALLYLGVSFQNKEAFELAVAEKQ